MRRQNDYEIYEAVERVLQMRCKMPYPKLCPGKKGNDVNILRFLYTVDLS